MSNQNNLGDIDDLAAQAKAAWKYTFETEMRSDHLPNQRLRRPRNNYADGSDVK